MKTLHWIYTFTAFILALPLSSAHANLPLPNEWSTQAVSSLDQTPIEAASEQKKAILDTNYNITFVGNQNRSNQLCSLGFGDRAENDPQIHFRLQNEKRTYISWSSFSLNDEGHWVYSDDKNELTFEMTLFPDHSPKTMKRYTKDKLTADCYF